MLAIKNSPLSGTDNNTAIDLCSCACPSVDKIEALRGTSKQELHSFTESVQTDSGSRTFRVAVDKSGSQQLQEQVTLKDGSLAWGNHNDDTIKSFYYSEGKLYNNQGKQIGELLLNPNHIIGNDKSGSS